MTAVPINQGSRHLRMGYAFDVTNISRIMTNKISNFRTIQCISNKKLFKLLIDRDMKKKDFKELTGISQGTLNKLQNGGNVMVDVLEKICLNMDCNVEDIMEIYPDPVDSTKKRTARSVQ